MSASSPFDDLRARLRAHGYHLFLRPARDGGWYAAIRNGEPGEATPFEAHATSRSEALQLAERLFVNHRLTELDGDIRASGRTPPPWTEPDQAARVETLRVFAAHPSG
jgi:hypothetical protein